MVAAYDQIPDSLTPKKKQALEKFLAGLEKPRRFIPEKAKVVSLPAAAPVAIDLSPPVAGEKVNEYLAEILPQRAADRDKGPDRVDVYWFRPNPKKGAPGVTVKRVVDLNTGKQVGDTEVLLNYAAPLTREEEAQAIRLAREKSAKVKRLYKGVKEDAVQVGALFQQISAKGVPEGAPGDRVVTLEFRRKKSDDIVRVTVNLTQETLRERD